MPTRTLCDMVSATGTTKARALGAELRAARKAAGLSQRAVAQALGVHQTTLVHWENGKHAPEPDNVARYLRAVGADEARLAELVEMARATDDVVWVSVDMPDLQRQLAALIQFERMATRIIDVSPMLIPGLLQTTSYTRAVMNGMPAPEVETRIAIRQGRQQVLTRPNQPAHMLALISEAALYARVGGTQVMAEQLQHLLRMAELPNVDVRIVPLALDWNPMMEGPFLLLEFAKADPIVHLEVRLNCLYVHQPDAVQRYQAAVDTVLSLSMSSEESIEFIAQQAKRMELE